MASLCNYLYHTPVWVTGWSFSCASLKATNQNSDLFILVPLEDNCADVEIQGNIPLFIDEKYSDFNKLILSFKSEYIDKTISEVEDCWASYKEDAALYEDDYPMTFAPDSFFYYVEPSVSENERFLSVVFFHENLTGGAHGAYWTTTFTWDKEKNCIASIYDVSGLSKSEISKICRKKIRAEYYGIFSDEDYKDNFLDWVNEGTGESCVDSMKFYVDENMVYVRFDPYEVGPWAMGECIIQIK